MNEDYKLAEAEYFYQQMLAVQQVPKHFHFNLSAFLAAARSVLQYALKEAKPKNGGQTWYDAAVVAHPSITFFKDKRDVSVHAEPVVAQTAIEVENFVHIGIEEAVEIHIFEDGELTGHHKSEPRKAEIPEKREQSVARYSYRFTDWTGSEDVLQLGRIYLEAIKAVVADGQNRGFLS